MAKKTDSDPDDGEQLDLIQTQPENAKAIARAAKRYKGIVKERQALTLKEVDAKQKLLAMIHDAKIQPNEDGTYTFRAGTVKIKVKPRDELVQVRLDEDEDGDDGGEE